MYNRCTAFCNLAEGFFVDNQMLINIREFQILTYLGHQLYAFLDVCYIEGEFVDIVWHRDTVTDGTFHSAMTGTFQSDTGGTSIPLLSPLPHLRYTTDNNEWI